MGEIGRISCLTLIDGEWEKTTTLLDGGRNAHCSWSSPSGVMLLGGGGRPETTEWIHDNGTSTYGFNLKYNLFGACAINIGQTVILTGGMYSKTEVSEYSETGFVDDLPQLQEGRQNHGCSFFSNGNTKVNFYCKYCDVIVFQTYLVTGGYNGVDNLQSTELLVETSFAWVLTGQLPTTRSWLRGANIDGRILMTGGYNNINGFLDHILE